jgi:hypothetical protein
LRAECLTDRDESADYLGLKDLLFCFPQIFAFITNFTRISEKQSAVEIVPFLADIPDVTGEFTA